MEIVSTRKGKRLKFTTVTVVTKELLITIVADLIFFRRLTTESSKNDVVRLVKKHLLYQGVTTYEDWYKHESNSAKIKAIKKQVEPMIKNLFPEL